MQVFKCREMASHPCHFYNITLNTLLAQIGHELAISLSAVPLPQSKSIEEKQW